MGHFDRAQVSGAYEKVMRRKFGDLYDWERPQVAKTVGPFTPIPVDNFSKKLNALFNASWVFLHELEIGDLSVLLDRNTPDQDGKRVAWYEYLDNKVTELQRGIPHWLSGGFGHSDYEADFKYWGQMEEFSLQEALLLSVGVEPKHFGEQKLMKAKETMENRPLLEAIEYLVKRHELFRRKFPTGFNGFLRVSPSFLHKWFREVSMDVHPRFLEVLQHRVEGTKSMTVAEAGIADKRVKTDRREVDKIAQLFAAMAIDQLGYDPKANRSPTPKEIADLVADMGLSVTDDTVRKYLKLGSSFIQ